MVIKEIKYVLIVVLLAINVGALWAGNRVIPLLEAPASARSLSLGGVRMGRAKGTYIYSNPSSFFQSKANISVDYSLGLFPSINENRWLHTLTAAYRHKKSSFFLGIRYFSMGEFKTILDENIQLDDTYQKNKFNAYSADVGYAYLLNTNLALHAKFGYAKEKTISSVESYQASVGAMFHKKNYSLGVEVANLGGYKYLEKYNSLAPLLKLGGALSIPTFVNQEVELSAEYGAFLPLGSNDFESQASIGIDYSFWEKYSLRLGGHMGEFNDLLSFGCGFKYHFLKLDIATTLPLHRDMERIYMVTAICEF